MVITLGVDGKILVNGVPVIDSNIETTNGILHITQSPIVKYEKISMASNGGLPLGAIIAVPLIILLIVAVIVGVVLYRKSKVKGIFNFNAGSDSNLSFARLQSGEEDSDTSRFSDSASAKYDNPVFNDPIFNDAELLNFQEA